MRTMLIGLDGATFVVLDQMAAAGVMPFISEFSAAGIRAPLRTIIPALTPPAWTSMMTGVGPGTHGVFDFFRKESADSHYLRFVTSRDMKAPDTVWSLANRHGLRAMVLNFPVTFPPPPVEGYVVPGWMPWKQLRLGCRPAGLYDRLLQIPGFDPRELAMDMSFEEKALEGCDRSEYLEWVELHINRERQWLHIVEALLDEEVPCELVTMVLDGPDKLQHLLWRYIDDSYAETWQSDEELEIREACVTYFRELDKVIERLVKLAGDDATVIIASDHGFGAQERTFFANAWLAEKGYLSWARDEVPRQTDQQQLGVGHIARHAYLLDWNKTVAYAPLPSGNGIHIIQQSETHPQGIPASGYEAFRERLRDELLALRTTDGEPVIAEVWFREEIFSGDQITLAPDLTLVMEDGGLISILDADAAVKTRSEPSGTHRPLGIFIAHGPHLPEGLTMPELSILDVAPLILNSLGIEEASFMEGALPAVALQDVGETRPRLPLVEQQVPDESDLELDEAAEAKIIERLQRLGYLE